MNITLQGPLAGLVVAGLALFLLLAPIGMLAKRRSPVAARTRQEPAPLWMTLFFRGLGLVLLALAGILLCPLLHRPESW